MLKNYLKIADASDVELAGCLEVARRFRLDPFKQGQIWFIKRWDKNAISASGAKGGYVYTPQVGIYGMLHIAARDHADYGSLSEAEYGPMYMHEVEGHKFKAPEWCRVKAFKKGVAEPTVATIYFEEFCPGTWDNARLFWAKMPRAQIEKCAKARAVRTAYPDLGGLYIPEECERMGEDYTVSGRQIVENVPDRGPDSPRMAANEVLRAQLEPLGLWCGKHGLPCNKCPADDHTTEELEAFDAAEARLKGSAGAAKPNEGGPSAASETQTPPVAPAGHLTIDWTLDQQNPVLTGDLEQFGVVLAEHKLRMDWGKDEFWHIPAALVARVTEIAMAAKFAVQVSGVSSVSKRSTGDVHSPAPLAPENTSAREGRQRGDRSAVPALDWMTGIIEQANPESGKVPRVSVLLKVDKTKHWMSAFDTKLFPWLAKGKGQEATLIVKRTQKGDKTYTNVIGFKRVAGQEFDDDGLTPVMQRDRPAGTPPSLFK